MKETLQLDGMIINLDDELIPDFIKPVYRQTFKIMKALSTTSLILSLLHWVAAVVFCILSCMYGGWTLVLLNIGCCGLAVCYIHIFSRTAIIEGQRCDEDLNDMGETVYFVNDKTAEVFNDIFKYVMYAHHSPEFDAQVKEYVEHKK